MKVIDVSKWKKFNICELFYTEKRNKKIQVPTGAAVPKKDLTEGAIPRITVTGINNGVNGYFSEICKNKNYRIYDNFISVSFLGTVFYQAGKATLDMKVHCLKPLTIQLNRYTGQYLVTCIRRSLKKSKYSDQISSSVLPQLDIYLPVDETGKPDFAYMESYMRNLESAVSASLTHLRSAKRCAISSKIDVTKWQEFHLYDIFDIDSGTKLDKAKMDTSEQEICFVGRSNFHNGITQKVKRIEGLKPYPAGCLTLALGGFLGSCFVQEEPFYTSQNVVVLIPKAEMSFLCKQFIATAIFRESQNNYRAFVKELNAHIKTDFTIKLPIKANDVPDYEFIETYMAGIRDRAEIFFEKLAGCC